MARTTTVFVSMVIAALAMPQAFSQQERSPGDSSIVIGQDKVRIEIRSRHGVMIEDLLAAVNEVAGIDFIYEENETENRGVQLVGSRELPRAELWPYVQTLLRSADYVCIPTAGADSKTFLLRNTNGLRKGQLPIQAPIVGVDEIRKSLDHWSAQVAIPITTTIQLQRLDARQAFTALRAYFPDQDIAILSPIDGANAVVMTSFAPAVCKMVRLLDGLDHASSEVNLQVSVIELKNASADELAPVVSKFVEKGESVVPDERTNFLMVYAAPTSIDRIHALVAVLDRKQ